MLEDVAKGLGSVVRFVIAAILWSIVLFQLGRGFLLVVTFGRFPRGNDLERYQNGISLTGVLVVGLTWSAIAVYNNLGSTTG